MYLDRLKDIKDRFNQITDLMSNTEVIADKDKYVSLNREYKQLSKIVDLYKLYKNINDNIQEAKSIISKGSEDKDIIMMAEEELEKSQTQKQELEERIKEMLIKKEPEDLKNAVVEIRAGTGGDEASIFAGDLYRMVSRYAEKKSWKVELVGMNEGTSGGFKEIIVNVVGEEVYGNLKFEAGVHRVQRIPKTETQGRVHTSAATIVVMPEAEEFDVKIDMNDVRKDLYCSSGPGGQSVNTTYSAVRLTHIPTGIISQCQDEKSQHKNFDKALKVLRSRIYDIEVRKKNEEESKKRKSMVSTGDRSAKIRTYNYPQGRVTDHRIGLTLYNLEDIMNGDLDKVIEKLKVEDNKEKIENN